MIRLGTYTLYKSHIFRLITESDTVKLLFEGETPPFPGFKSYPENIFILTLPKTELTNAFFVTTKCIYRQFVFDIEAENDEFYHLITANALAQKKFGLHSSDGAIYQMIVKKDAVESVWEERSEAFNDLPYPNGFPKTQHIYLCKSTVNLN